jgi:transposase
MGYRFIQLSPEDVSLLEKTSKTSSKAHIRRKCDTILLSNRGYDINTLSGLYKIRTHTIRDWMDNWIAKGIDGFSISTGRGRKAEIDPNNTDLVDLLTKAIKLNPQNLDTVCAELNKSEDLSLTKNKVIRFLKKS